MGGSSRSTGLSRGFLERTWAPKVARERLREVIRDNLGLSRGRLDPSESRSRVDENANSAKSGLRSWMTSRIHLGLTLGRSGPLLGRSWGSSGRSWGAPGRSWSVLGALLGHSRGPLGCSLGALEVHLGPPEASGTPRGSIFKGFWIDLGVDLGGFGDRTW